MPKFIKRETKACYVTFISLVEAEDEAAAATKFLRGEGTLIGEEIGDGVSFLDETTVEIAVIENRGGPEQFTCS